MNNITDFVEALKEKGLYSDVCDTSGYVVGFDKSDMYYFEECCTQEAVDKATALVKSIDDPCEIPKELMKSGVLSCEPTLVRNSLVYGMGAYLHWFRGCYFQISGTHTGVGTREQSYLRMDSLISSSSVFDYNTKTTRAEFVNFVLVMCSLTTALHYYDKTMKLISSEDGIETYNKFLKVSARGEHDASQDICLDDVMKYVSVTRSKFMPSIEPDDGMCILLADDGVRKSYAVLHVSHRAISVHCKEENGYVCYKFTVPEWFSAVDADGNYLLKHRCYAFDVFIEFIIGYAGIRCSGLVIYPIKSKLSKKVPISYNCSKVATSFAELFEIVDSWFGK